MEPISNPFFTRFIIGGLGGGVVLSLFAQYQIEHRSPQISFYNSLLLLGLALIMIGVGTVFLMIFLHRIWTALQPAHPRTTPGKAIGLMFIPFFNLYWVFQVYWGWAKDFNLYIEKEKIDTQPIPEQLALGIGILTIGSMIPMVGNLAVVLNLGFLFAFLNKATTGVNALIAHQRPTA